MTLEEFREELINEIKGQSLIDSEYPADIFIEYCKDILINDFGVISDLYNTYIDYKTDNTQYRNMRLDASYLELSINTVHLLISDFNEGEIQPINKEFILVLDHLEIWDKESYEKYLSENEEEFEKNAEDLLSNEE